MGWKNVRDHYRIRHIVQVTPEGVCIGSGYVHDLIVIGPHGEIRKRYGEGRSAPNDDLARYQREIDADAAKLRELLQSPDTFSRSLAVYTFDDGTVREKQCEQLGWPNVTHDGCLMYENRFSPDRAKVLEWAHKDVAAAIRWAQRSIQQLEKDLECARASLATHQRNQAKLLCEGPGADAEDAAGQERAV